LQFIFLHEPLVYGDRNSTPDYSINIRNRSAARPATGISLDVKQRLYI
jgi:hypothetical protein